MASLGHCPCGAFHQELAFLLLPLTGRHQAAQYSIICRRFSSMSWRRQAVSDLVTCAVASGLDGAGCEPLLPPRSIYSALDVRSITFCLRFNGRECTHEN